MKISKVDHVKTAVTNERTVHIGEQEIEGRGKLYKVPDGSRQYDDIVGRVQKLNESAKRLYSIFNNRPKNDGRKSNEKVSAVKLLPSDVNSFCFKYLLDYRGDSEHLPVPEKDNRLSFLSVDELKNAVDESALSVRKSLQAYRPVIRYYLLMKAGLILEKNEIPSSEDQQEFIDAFHEDYYKTRRAREIAASIIKQNTKVAVNNGEIVLSNWNHSQKKYLYNFIQKYACANVEQRREITSKLERLIMSFYGFLDTPDTDVDFYEACSDSADTQEKTENAIFGGKEVETLLRQRTDIGREIKDNDDQQKAAGRDYKTRNTLKKSRRELDIRLKKTNDTLNMKIASQILDDYQRVRHTAVSDMGAQNASCDQYPEELSELLYWLEQIEREAEKLLSKTDKEYKFYRSYLMRHTYNDLKSMITGKYIDIGKALYHFAVNTTDRDHIVVGDLLDKYKEGITSFDYEIIKANESIEREMNVQILFAVNNFSRAVTDLKRLNPDAGSGKAESDILLLKREEFKAVEKEPRELIRSFTQYFGGQSEWKNDDRITEKSIEDLVWVVKALLYGLRNSCFHYSGSFGAMDSKTEELSVYAQELFLYERSGLGKVYRKKYYSNNVWMFYSAANIEYLMNQLYGKVNSRPSQIPAFNRIYNKDTLYEDPKFVKQNAKSKISKVPETIDQFKNSLFFVMKEIYYNEFIYSEKAKQLFFNILEAGMANLDSTILKKALRGESAFEYTAPDSVLVNRYKDLGKENREAYIDFFKRVEDLKDQDFSVICQTLMTDYEQQNNHDQLVHLETRKDGKYRPGYQHYKMLLYRLLRDAFREFVNGHTDPEGKKDYEFLRSPMITSAVPSEEEFINEWSLQVDVPDTINQECLAWYIAAHFMPPAQLNHLTGSVMSYQQFLRDIQSRARAMGIDRDAIYNTDIADRYNSIGTYLQMARLYNGQISNVIEDYFADEEEYAQYIHRFVRYEYNGVSYSSSLRQFCNEKLRAGKKEYRYGIFYDGINPVLNRNVVQAKLFGDVETVSALAVNQKDGSQAQNKVVVTENDIQQYYKTYYDDIPRTEEQLKKASDDKSKSKYVCSLKEDVRNAQNMKNKIELYDISAYMGIVNELYAQLVNWVYLRERDLLYFQLGYHYTKLISDPEYSKTPYMDQLLTTNGKSMYVQKGAILYELIAIYTYAMPIIVKKKDGSICTVSETGSSTGAGINAFVELYGAQEYEDGLELFENIIDAKHDKAHDSLIAFRNSIDHFEFYATHRYSLMDMYSRMYGKFLAYDRKLQKTVTYMLMNILAKNFVIGRICMEKNKEPRDGRLSTDAQIIFDKVYSSKFTYKLDEYGLKGETCEVPARTEEFCDNVAAILEYKKGDAM